MSLTYKTTPGKRFQVVLRKKNARNGIVAKEFFDTEDAANIYVEENEANYYCEFLDLEYNKAV